MISLSAHTLSGVLDEILLLGRATGHLAEAEGLVARLQARIRAVSEAAKLVRRPRVLCLEWLDPLFQGGHWIPEMVALAGGDPVLASAGEKSVRITWEQVAEADPEVIVLMPCGYHLTETVEQFRSLRLPQAWQSLTAVGSGQIYAVDGTAYFSRPGPRLVDGLEILHAILGGRDFVGLPAESVERIS